MNEVPGALGYIQKHGAYKNTQIITYLVTSVMPCPHIKWIILLNVHVHLLYILILMYICLVCFVTNM